jgi:CcmD family protein
VALKSYAFLFWAYNVIWLALAGYLLFLLLRVGRIGRRLDGVERALDASRRSRDQESSGS